MTQLLPMFAASGTLLVAAVFALILFRRTRDRGFAAVALLFATTAIFPIATTMFGESGPSSGMNLSQIATAAVSALALSLVLRAYRGHPGESAKLDASWHDPKTRSAARVPEAPASEPGYPAGPAGCAQTAEKQIGIADLSDAVLDSLTAQTAVLDQDGIILAVNEAWERFAGENGVSCLSGMAVGRNYLERCRQDSGEFAGEAPKVFAGVQAVLQGSGDFLLEYPYESSRGRLWFLLSVTPLRRLDGGAVISHTDITGRKKAEELLQDAHAELETRVAERTAELSEANQRLGDATAEHQRTTAELRLLEAAVRSTHEPILITDSQLDEPGPRIEFVNEALSRLTGYRPDEILGKTPRILQGTDTEPEFRERLKKTLRAGQPFSGEVNNYRKDGSEYCVELYVSPVLEQDGEVKHYVATQRDVTDRKLAEEALRKSEQRYRLLFDAMTSGGVLQEVICDEHGRPCDISFLEVNPAFERFTGLRAEDVLGKTVREVFPEVDSYWIDTLGETALTGRPVQFERFSPLLNRFYEVTAYCPEKGHCAVILNDITDRKRAEEALRLTQFAVDHAGEAIFWLSRDGRFRYVNNAACEALGYSREELLSMTIHQVDPGVTPQIWSKHWKRVKRRGALTFESLQRNRDAVAIPVEISANYLEFDGKEFHCAFVRDITDRKRAEERLRKWERIFEHAGWGIAIVGADGSTMEMMNPALAVMHGYRREELTGGSVLDLLAPEVGPDVQQQIATAEQKGHHSFETKHCRKDRSVFPVLQDLTIVKDDQDRPRYRIVNVQDLTELKLAEDIFDLAAISLWRQDFTEVFRELDRLKSEGVTDLGRYFAAHPEQLAEWAARVQVLRVNRVTRELYQANSESDLLGPINRVFTAESLPVFQDVLVEMSAGVTEIVAEQIHRSLRGRPIDVLLTLSLFTVPGERKEALVSVMDITERKRAEEALRESEARLNLALQAGQIGTWLWGVKDGSLFWDDRLHSMFGLTPGEVQVTYQRFLDLIHPADVERVNRALGRALDEGAEYDIDYRVVWPDGSVHFLTSRGSVLRDERGRRRRMTGVCQDITERKRAEEALRNSEARLRAIMETAVDGIVATDDRGIVESVNPAAEALFGYTAEELIGNHVKILMPSPMQEEHQQAIATYVRTGKKKVLGKKHEQVGRRKDGTTFPIELTVSEFWAGEARRFAGIVRDITRRKQAEEQRQRYLADLEETKQLTERQALRLAGSNAELEQFAYIASHDLQEPLRMVGGYTQLLAKRYQGRFDSEAQEFMGFVLDGVKRMQQLITDLLAYSRAGRSEQFDLVETQDCVRDSLANLKTALEETQATVDRDSLPTVPGDGTQLTQLFQNLIGNALKYRSPDAPRVRISAQKRGGEWVFSVRDNGIGVEPRYHDRIFQVFQRLHTRDEYAGTGIGLSICKKIVESHGGRIWVESQPGEGSTFSFSLPVQAVQPR